MTSTARRYVLIDRDGTINEEREYLSNPDQLALLPNAAAGLRRMQELGFGIVVVTNQSGIARGYFGEENLQAIHARLENMLAAEGVELAAILHCPHGPGDGCGCRKPLTGMAEAAAARFRFPTETSFVIGDKAADIELGQAIGATTFLVETGYGSQVWHERKAWPDFVVPDLLAAAGHMETLVRAPVLAPGGLPADAGERIRSYLMGSMETKRRLLAEGEADILVAAQLIVAAMRAGRKLMICENGGGAADSPHVGTGVVSTLNHAFSRRGLPTLALTTGSSPLTANAGDYALDEVFEQQLRALGQPGDVLMSISASGNSANVLRAAAYARAHGIATIGLCGGDGGKLSEICAVVLRAPSLRVPFVEETHMALGHILCDLVEQALFGHPVQPVRNVSGCAS